MQPARGNMAATMTERDTTDWDMITVPLYFGTSSATAVNAVVSTINTKTYV